MHKKDFYQTHLTEGQWSYINKVFFENDCRHRKNSFRSIFEAILFILVSGCQWRMLPKDFPKWKTVYWFPTDAQATTAMNIMIVSRLSQRLLLRCFMGDWRVSVS